MKKNNTFLLSQELMLQALYDQHSRVKELTEQLAQARRLRDDMMYDARQSQVSLSRICKTVNMSVTNVQPIFEKVERRRSGLG
jgi:translation initiation factor 2B subunit (eIF-2B alpha/beta/delta family)